EINGGILSGPGTIATIGALATVISGARSVNSLTLSANSDVRLNSFDNGGNLNLAATKTLTLKSFTNTATGKMTTDGIAKASDFVTNGQITVARTGKLLNVGSSGLTFGGGSQTTVSRVGPLDNVDDGIINLGSADAVLAGGQMINNGVIASSASGVNFIVDF